MNNNSKSNSYKLIKADANINLSFHISSSELVKVLMIFSIIIISFLLISQATEGIVAMWAIIGIVLFSSNNIVKYIQFANYRI